MTFFRDHLALLLLALLVPVVLLPVDVLVPLAVLGILGVGLAAGVDWARHDALDVHRGADRRADHRADHRADDLPRDLWPEHR